MEPGNLQPPGQVPIPGLWGRLRRQHMGNILRLDLRSSIHLSLWVCWCPRHWASPPISAGVLHMRHLLPGGGVSRGVRKLQPKKETLLWDCGCSGLRRLPGRNGRNLLHPSKSLCPSKLAL
nr:putative uncharacterized protein C5orf66 homolog isoform X4 [Macaca nemestrina]